MKKIHPCCGYPTQLGAKFIAICELIFGLIGIFWFIFILQSYGLLLNASQLPGASKDLPINATYQETTAPEFNDWFLSLHANNETSKNTSSGKVIYNQGSIFAVTNSGIEIYKETANICLSGSYTLINLCMSVLLLSAANERSVCQLMLWFAIRMFIILFKVVIYIIYIVIRVSASTQLPHIFFMFVHAYGLWIVWVFVKEIKNEERNQQNSSTKPSKATGVENKEFSKDHLDLETEDEPPCDRPQKRKMTITIIEPDRVTIFEPYVGDGAGVEIKGTEKEHKENTEDENTIQEDKVIKSILHKPRANSNAYRNSY